MNKQELSVILDSFGWTQRKLAERMGISEITVSRWDEVPTPVAEYIKLVRNTKQRWDELK